MKDQTNQCHNIQSKHVPPQTYTPQPDMVEPFMIFKFYTRSPNYKLWAMYSVGGVYVYGWACQVEKCNFRMVSHNKLNPILLNRKWMFETIRGPVCGRHCKSPFVEISGISQQQQSNQEHRWEWFIVKSNITSNKLQNFETVSRGSSHRSNHTQKYIPSVVARHRFLQFSCINLFFVLNLINTNNRSWILLFRRS